MSRLGLEPAPLTVPSCCVTDAGNPAEAVAAGAAGIDPPDSEFPPRGGPGAVGRAPCWTGERVRGVTDLKKELPGELQPLCANSFLQTPLIPPEEKLSRGRYTEPVIHGVPRARPPGAWWEPVSQGHCCCCCCCCGADAPASCPQAAGGGSSEGAQGRLDAVSLGGGVLLRLMLK